MKYLRRAALTLFFALALGLGTAHAQGEIALDGIGLRYTPAAGETCLTRDTADPAVLAAFGADAETLQNAMRSDGAYLIRLGEDGLQVTLTVTEKPEGIASAEAAQMTAAEKDVFLKALARQGGYGTANWHAHGYALFASAAEQLESGGLTYAGLTLATLYLDHVYAFHMDLIGREAGQAEPALLEAMAERTLRLGAAAQAADGADTPAQVLTLPDTAVPSAPLEWVAQSQSCALTLDPVAATLGVTQFTLSGTTEPGGAIRYAVNGKSSSRIVADAQGAFRVTVPNLKGNAENAIVVTATKGDLKTQLTGTVTVQWLDTPLALETVTESEAELVTVRGLTLPGTALTLTQGRAKGALTVAADGAFTLTLRLPRIGENAFTLRAQATGFRRAETAFVVTRVRSAVDTQTTLLKQVRTVDFARLTAKPAAFAGTAVQLSGTASQLDYADGSPRFTLTDAQGAAYTVLCDQLLAVREGDAVTLLGTLTGETDQNAGYPTLTLAALL